MLGNICEDPELPLAEGLERYIGDTLHDRIRVEPLHHVPNLSSFLARIYRRLTTRSIPQRSMFRSAEPRRSLFSARLWAELSRLTRGVLSARPRRHQAGRVHAQRRLQRDDGHAIAHLVSWSTLCGTPRHVSRLPPVWHCRCPGFETRTDTSRSGGRNNGSLRPSVFHGGAQDQRFLVEARRRRCQALASFAHQASCNSS